MGQISEMKILLIAFIALIISFQAYSTEKSIKHKVVPDIVSMDEAKAVFAKTTSQLQGLTILDEAELHDVHMITYSLEKAVAYFVDNMIGGDTEMAAKMAELVELVHIASENNNAVETKNHLADYFEIAGDFEQRL